MSGWPRQALLKANLDKTDWSGTLAGMPRDGTATRERILDVATDIAMDRGFAAASLDEVLTQSGVTKGAFYHYFDSKADLGRTILDRYATADLETLDLPQDYWVLLVLPRKLTKSSTERVYADFDARGGARGYEERRVALVDALERVKRPRDLAALPLNDLASSPLARQLVALGAFRADITGAGPTVYALFLHGQQARAAQKKISREGRTWLTTPAWYR